MTCLSAASRIQEFKQREGRRLVEMLTLGSRLRCRFALVVTDTQPASRKLRSSVHRMLLLPSCLVVLHALLVITRDNLGQLLTQRTHPTIAHIPDR